MAFVQTTTGAHVSGRIPGKPDAYTWDQAEASAADCNRRAEELGISTRYEAHGAEKE